MNRATITRAVAGVLCATMAAGFAGFLLSAGTYGAHAQPAVEMEPYTERSAGETGSINVATAILMDYRSFDTLGEATVIFTAVAVAAAILGKPRFSADRTMGLLSRRLLSAVLPLFFVFPVFVVLHGHISPGGGFQGGVSLAVLVILVHVAFGDRFGQRTISLHALSLTEYSAALGLAGAGFIGIFQGAAYFANAAAGISVGTPGTLAAGGIIPLLNILVGLKVAAGLSSLYIYLVGHHDGGLERDR